MGLLESLIISAGMFTLVLIVLLFVWAIKTPKKSEVREEVKGDLKKIKDQINDE